MSLCLTLHLHSSAQGSRPAYLRKCARFQLQFQIRATTASARAVHTGLQSVPGQTSSVVKRSGANHGSSLRIRKSFEDGKDTSHFTSSTLHDMAGLLLDSQWQLTVSDCVSMPLLQQTRGLSHDATHTMVLCAAAAL